jgi:integrase
MNGSTYVNFDKAHMIGLKLIRNSKSSNIGLLIICGCNLGLRISDLVKLTFAQLKKDELILIEQKTKKKRIIQINHNIKDALRYFESDFNYVRGGYCFLSQKGTKYSSQQINRLLKKYFKGERISTHSLRKSFGRRVWENNGKSDEALIYLSEIFNHSSMSITRKYLGIRQEELNDIYLKL